MRSALSSATTALTSRSSVSPTASGSEAYVFRLDTTAASLAQSILLQLRYSSGLPDRGVFSRPTLYVLRRTRMPAVLVEMGFISNSYDAALMAGQPWLFANGIANGILDFLGML